MEPSVINKCKTKTTAQLSELSADLKGELKQLRGNLRACEDAVKERERAKQSKFAELREASAGSALDWVRLKHGAQFPEVFDACIEEARDAAQDAQGRVSEMEARLVAIQEKIDKVDAASEEGATTLFIHFVPPALRAHGKSDLPWIVHTCDGSGCIEARHVSFHSVSAFSTFEGTPPEQLEGKACRCHIANHHLRGRGRVRWDGPDDAVIENDATGKSGAMINGQAYREHAYRQAAALTQAREEIKRLRAVRLEMANQNKQELVELRGALAGLEEKNQKLAMEHALLNIKHDTQNKEWKRLLTDALQEQQCSIDQSVL